MMARVIGPVPLGLNPQHMAVTPDSRFAYVANNNNYDFAGEDTVTVINLRTNQAVTTISHASFDEPYTITMNKAGTLAYVTNSASSTVSVIDTRTRTVVDVIDGFDGPSGMVIQGNFGYVNNYGASLKWDSGSQTNIPDPTLVGSGSGNTVSVVNLTTRQVTSSFTVGAAPAAIGSDGTFIYTANYVSGNLNTGTMSKYRLLGGGAVSFETTIGPQQNAFTATVNNAPRSYQNPSDYQVLYSTPGTVTGTVFNVGGVGDNYGERPTSQFPLDPPPVSDYDGFLPGQIALIARDTTRVTEGTEYLQASVDYAAALGASAVIFYNAEIVANSPNNLERIQKDGLTGSSPDGVFPTSVLFPGNLYQQPGSTAIPLPPPPPKHGPSPPLPTLPPSVVHLIVPVVPIPVIFVSNAAVIQEFMGGAPNAGVGRQTLTSVSTVSLNTSTAFSGPFGMAIRGPKAYVTNFGSNNFAPFGRNLLEVDLRGSGTILSSIPVGIQPSGVAISRNGRFAYVTNYNTLYAGVSLTPNGTFTPPTKSLSPFSGHPLGGQPNYASQTAGAGTVSVIDLRTKRVIKTVAVGLSPSNIVVTPNGKRALVANYTSNTVTVIALG